MQAYRFSIRFLGAWMMSVLLRRPPRPFAGEMERALAPYRGRITAFGQEHLPPTGPFVVAANHYQRRGLGAEWIAIAISVVISEAVPGADVRWMHTDGRDGYRILDRLAVPPWIARRFLAWVSRRYGFLPVATESASMRAPMLRDAYRLLHRAALPIGIMPEGANARNDGVLAPAKEGAGAALGWLCGGAVPIITVGVYETDDGTLLVRFAPPFVPPPRAEPGTDAAEIAEHLMRQVARMLPPRLQGPYAEALE